MIKKKNRDTQKASATTNETTNETTNKVIRQQPINKVSI